MHRVHLFHVERHDLWRNAAEWGNRRLSASQLEKLDHYRQWLVSEALQAGGIGPDEPERVDARHIGDSLLFAAGFEDDPERVVDLGSGVGLPGIPLSILLPDSHFDLVDRSGKRVDLMKRVVAILDLPNVEVFQGEISLVTATYPAVVSRATLTPDETSKELSRLLEPSGQAVIGGSWVEEPDHQGWDSLQVPPEVLDHDVWLLIMRHP